MDIEKLQAQRDLGWSKFSNSGDLYLFGFALFNLYVLIGATVLRRRVADLLDERKGLLANEAPSEATRL